MDSLKDKPLVEGQEPTHLKFDASSPFSTLQVRLAYGECLRCGRVLDLEDGDSLWCYACKKEIDWKGSLNAF